MKKLLFVDDEPLFLEGIKRLLRKHKDQWQTATAGSCDQALQMVEQESYDLVLSDINMPGKSGFDLLAALQDRRETRSIPVIIITGAGDSGLKKKALTNGATDLLAKPVDYGDLIARITSALRLKSYQDEIVEQNATLEQRVLERTADLEFLHQDLIWRLAKAGEMRDEETGDHVIRVAHYCRIIACAIGLSDKEVKQIFFTSPLHDLGKIGTPDGILLKKGTLSELEWSIMTQHCEVGAAILLEKPKGMEFTLPDYQPHPSSIAANDELKQIAASIALSHHEKWNGSGYPKGLQGEEIPLAGRIAAYADVYDALRSARPYKKEFDKEKAWSIIEEGVGSHFDPNIFEKIKDIQKDFEAIRRKHLEQ